MGDDAEDEDRRAFDIAERLMKHPLTPDPEQVEAARDRGEDAWWQRKARGGK